MSQQLLYDASYRMKRRKAEHEDSDETHFAARHDAPVCEHHGPCPLAVKDVNAVDGDVITLNYSGLYPRTLVLGHGSIALYGVPATEEYRYIKLVLVDNNGQRGFDGFAAREETGIAAFTIPQNLTGAYELRMFHNSELYGTFSGFLYNMSVQIDAGRARWVQSPVYERSLSFAASETRDAETLAYYLRPSEGIQSDDPQIIETARKITDGVSGDYKKALALHDWVCNNIYYNYDAYYGKAEFGDNSALGVLKSHKSVCEGYSNLLAALLRASGIPAKKISGYALGISGGDTFPAEVLSGNGEANHAWNEAFLDDRWVVIDSTWDSGNRFENGGTASSSGCYQHRYFDISRELLSLDHTAEKAGNYQRLYLYVDYPEYRVGEAWFPLTDDGISPVVRQGRMLAPVKEIIEAMGGTYEFTPGNDRYMARVTCRLGDSFAQMWIGSTWLYVDKTDYTFATAPEIVNGNVVLPIATLFQAMGCDVTWDDAADQWYGRATIGYIE